MTPPLLLPPPLRQRKTHVMAPPSQLLERPAERTVQLPVKRAVNRNFNLKLGRRKRNRMSVGEKEGVFGEEDRGVGEEGGGVMVED